MDNGHSWASIQEYSLSEIGAFLKVIVKKEIKAKSDRISEIWLGSNLKYKALQEVLKKMDDSAKTAPATPEDQQREIQKNWIKLASFMKGQR